MKPLLKLASFLNLKLDIDIEGVFTFLYFLYFYFIQFKVSPFTWSLLQTLNESPDVQRKSAFTKQRYQLHLDVIKGKSFRYFKCTLIECNVFLSMSFQKFNKEISLSLFLLAMHCKKAHDIQYIQQHLLGLLCSQSVSKLHRFLHKWGWSGSIFK